MRFRLLSGCFSFLCLLFTNAPALLGGTTPSVALSTSSTSVTEGDNSSISVEITISWAQERALTFGLQFQGPGVVNEDFVDLPPNIEIPAGATKGTVTIAIQDDTFIEGVETVTASINNLPDGIDRAEQSEASFKIEDNDFATIRLSASSTRKTEGSPAFQFDVELDTMEGMLKKDLIISLSLDTSNRAVGTFGDNTTPLIPGQDFRIFPEQITFPSGSPNGDKKSVEAVFHSDNRIEGEEQATIILESSSDTAISTLSARHIFIIEDQNSPTITFSSSETLLTEGETNSMIGVKLDLGTDQLETNIDFKLIPNVNDTAKGNFPVVEPGPSNAQGIDYNISPTSLSFQLEGQTLLNIAVEALQDQLVEGEEVGSLSVQLTTPGFPQFSPPTPHTIRVSDADRATVQFQTARSEVSETDQPTNLNVILDTGTATLGAPLRIAVVNRNIGRAIGRFGNATAEAEAAPPSNSDDFELAETVFEFSTGDKNQTVRSLSIRSLTDLLIEGTESASLGLSIISGPVSLGDRRDHTYIIADTNSATIDFAQTEASFDEDTTNQEINLVLNTGGAFLAVPVEVQLGDSGNSTAIGDINSPPIEALAANANADYTIPNSSITFPTGSGDQTNQTISANILADQRIEGEEIANLGFTRMTGPASAGTSSGFILKINDLNRASVTFVEATSSVNEANAPTHSVSVQLSTSGASLAKTFSTSLSFTDGSAASASDFQIPENLAVEWQAGTVGDETQTISIPIVDDELLETTESFEIAIQAPSLPLIAGSNLRHTVSITDNDQAVIGLDPIRTTASEDGDPIDVAIQLSKAASTITEVIIELGGDAGANTSQLTRQIAAGETRFLMRLFVVDDDIVEGPETVTLRLASITSGDSDIQIDTENQQKSIIVLDNDTSIVSLEATTNAMEDETAGELTIKLSKAVTQPLNFDLSFTGTATGNTDYVTPSSQITVPARATSHTVTFPVIADNLAEPTESILTSIASSYLSAEGDPSDLAISVQTGATELLIIDNDHTPEANADLGQLFTIDEDETLTLTAENGLLANDTDSDDGNGPSHLTASLDGSLPANAQSFTLNPDGSFTYHPTPNFNGTDTFRYRASDGTNQSESTLVTITVTPVNDAPSIQGPETQLVNEGGQIIFGNATENQLIVNDVDLDESPLELSLSSAGSLTLASVDGLVFSQGNGQENPSMSFTGSPGSINRALDGLIYQTPSGAAPDLLNLVANDRGNSGAGGVQETRRSIPISIRPLNATPQLVLTDISPINVIGSSSRAAIAPGLIVSDGNDAELDSAQVSISSGFNTGQDELFIPRLPDGLTGEFDSNTGALSLRGPAPIAFFQAALREISFGNSSVTPTTGTRQLSIVVSDGKVSSNTIVRDINVSAPAFPPILNARTSQSRTFTEGGFPLALLGNVSISEGTGGRITRATATISSGYLSGEDNLSGGTASGLESNFDPSTGTLTVTGSGTTGAFSSALASVLYSNTSDSPSSGERTVTFSIEDSQRSGNSLSATISVISVNDAPRIQASTATPRTFTQGDDPISLFSQVSITDNDHSQLGGATAMFSTRFLPEQDSLELGPLPTGLSSTGFDKENGSLSITGMASFSDYIDAIQSIAFSNAADFTTDRSPSVSLMVADPDGATSNSVTQRLSLVGRSTPPEIVGLSDVSFPEDTKVFEIPFSLRDDRTPSPLIKFDFKLIAADDFFPKEDGVLLKRSDGNAVLSLHPLPNAAGEFSIEATATDAQNLETKTRIIVTIENINDLPLLAASPLDPLVFFDGSGPRPLFDAFEIKDPDHKILFGAKLSFNSGFIPHQDSIELRSAGPIQAEYDRTTGTINLTGKGSPEEYSETIQSITYKNLSHLPSESKRSLEIVVMDTPETASKPVMMEIQVFDANLPPVGQPDRIATKGETNIEIPFTTLLENDSDPENERLSISLVSNRTQQGIFLSTRANSVVLSSPPAGVRDHFFYTVADPSGGYAIVRVTIEP